MEVEDFQGPPDDDVVGFDEGLDDEENELTLIFTAKCGTEVKVPINKKQRDTSIVLTTLDEVSDGDVKGTARIGVNKWRLDALKFYADYLKYKKDENKTCDEVQKDEKLFNESTEDKISVQKVEEVVDRYKYLIELLDPEVYEWDKRYKVPLFKNGCFIMDVLEIGSYFNDKSFMVNMWNIVMRSLIRTGTVSNNNFMRSIHKDCDSDTCVHRRCIDADHKFSRWNGCLEGCTFEREKEKE